MVSLALQSRRDSARSEWAQVHRPCHDLVGQFPCTRRHIHSGGVGAAGSSEGSLAAPIPQLPNSRDRPQTLRRHSALRIQIMFFIIKM